MDATRTMVIDEDLHVLDAGSREPASRAAQLLARGDAAADGGRVGESASGGGREPGPAGPGASVGLHGSVVRSCTAAAHTGAELRTALRERRDALRAAGAETGLVLVAAGALPLAPPGEPLVDESPGLRRLLADYEYLARDQVYGGTRVRVATADRDEAVRVAGRVAPHLPVFLALAASSPFLRDGSDTGYASYRSMAASRWPTVGPVAAVRSAVEYDALVDGLVSGGVIADASLVRFGVQPGDDDETVDLLVCDACPNADTAVLVAMLFRALVVRESAALADGAEATVPVETLLRASMWRAARSGLEGVLVDPATARPRPAAEVISELVDGVSAELREAGDLDLARVLLDDALYNGSSAYRQRQTAARRVTVVDVVDLLVAETDGTAGGRSALPESRDRLFGAYLPIEGLEAEPTWDEAVDAAGEPRSEYAPLLRRMEALGTVALRSRQVLAEREAAIAGVAFRVTGDDRPRPFPMDFVPRVVSAGTWEHLAAGMEQRALALEAFLEDVYGPQEFVAAGHLTAEALDRTPGYRPATGRAVGPGGVRAPLGGVDLVCTDDGRWLVLEDNLRMPSGVAFCHAQRAVSRTVYGDLLPGYDVRDPGEAFGMIRRTLEAAAPPAVTDRAGSAGATGSGAGVRLALLSAGPSDSGWFEHRRIAEETGAALVTPATVAVRDGVLHHRDAHGWHPLDVVYARIDEDMLLSSPGADGEPLRDGLIEALSAGRLTIANALGNGVADDKAVYAAVPAMIDFFLGQTPILEQVPTFLCADREQRDHVLTRLEEMVVKPIDGYGGAGITIGPESTDEELARRREELLTHPERYIAQDVVPLSTLPTFDGTGMQRRHVDFRGFCHVRREGGRTTAHAVPTGLTRVAPPGSMIVNSSRGGGGKDTWILR